MNLPFTNIRFSDTIFYRTSVCIGGDYMERVILHSDLNNFYASVECLLNPQYKDKPIAVSGNPEKRHGIVLAKNMLAKECGVKTGEALWEAKLKCPDIIFLPPHYSQYIEISKAVRDIYYEYTSQIESFGIDECWLDVTDSLKLFKDGSSIAQEIRSRVKKEIGVTVSIGVSFNKIFAKLGSDLKKPDAVTIIDKSNFREFVWGLNIGELLYAGRSTVRRLKTLNINTIGDLALADCNVIANHLGKNGIMLQQYARGMDESIVSEYLNKREIKSIGNGTTMPYDLSEINDVKVILMLLSESVSARLREKKLFTSCIHLDIKRANLTTFSRQITLPYLTNSTKTIFNYALKIFNENTDMSFSIRSLSVRACKLSKKETSQLTFLNNTKITKNEKALGIMEDKIRDKYGWASLQKGIMLTNRELALINPISNDSIQKIAFFKG